MMPHAKSSTLIGIKCNTIITAKRSKAASQLSSGTEKLKVLKWNKRKKVTEEINQNADDDE